MSGISEDVDNSLVTWTMWIDIEGFGYLYQSSQETKALQALMGLMKDLYAIGCLLYAGEGERLFVHQVGDGFIVEPNFGDKDLLRPISIAVGLLRAALLRDSCLKVGIGVGQLADIQGCFPPEIRDTQENGRLRLGAGIMTVFTVMGGGLVDAHEVSGKASGPLLIVKDSLFEMIKSEHIPSEKNETHILVDWIHADTKDIDRILNTLLGFHTQPPLLERKLTGYLGRNKVSEPWRMAAERLVQGYLPVTRT